MEYYNGIFTLASVRDEWTDRKQLAVQHVTLRPLQLPDVSKVSAWLKVPAVRESFVPQFPEKQSELRKYFADPTREYFGIYYDDQLVGIVGGENIDLTAGKLEMKKLVGESGLQGKGIGKRATFGFLYYAFMIRNLNKVYIHSRDINMRNINLNSRLVSSWKEFSLTTSASVTNTRTFCAWLCSNRSGYKSFPTERDICRATISQSAALHATCVLRISSLAGRTRSGL